MRNGYHYNAQIEKAVLGMCILFNATGRIFGTLEAESFYIEDNRKIFAILLEFYNQGRPVNQRTIWEAMEEKSIVLNAGNTPWYLSTLEDNITNPSSLEYEALIIKKMWRRRKLIELRNTVTPTGDEREEIGQLIKDLNSIQGAEYQKDWFAMDELMYELIKHQADIKAGNIKLITTGFRALDRQNGGFSGGQMIVIGARPGVGKSALMGKMAVSMARTKHKVGIVSLEMNNNEIAARLASLETDFDFATIYRNLFKDENDHQQFYDIVARSTSQLPIYVSSKTKVDINQIRSKAAKLANTHGVDCLMIDYLQLVESSSTNRNYNREQEVANISRGLKLLAMEMDIPVIVLCQLNRNVTGRSKWGEHYPRLSDLRESGAIEQDADIVMMLHRDWTSGWQVFPEGEKAGQSTERSADLLALKWRNGAPVHLELDFIPENMRFQEPNSGRLIPINLAATGTDDDRDPF